MARPDSSRLFFSHRRIVGDESTHRRRGGGEVNADPPTHAVADYADARVVHVTARQTIAPALINDANKIRVGGLVLNRVAVVEMRIPGVPDHLVEVWSHHSVTEVNEP